MTEGRFCLYSLKAGCENTLAHFLKRPTTIGGKNAKMVQRDAWLEGRTRELRGYAQSIMDCKTKMKSCSVQEKKNALSSAKGPNAAAKSHAFAEHVRSSLDGILTEDFLSSVSADPIKRNNDMYSLRMSFAEFDSFEHLVESSLRLARGGECSIGQHTE